MTELGLEAERDLAIWERCISEQRVLVTKDVDFLFLAQRPGNRGRLIWVRLGNCRNDELLAAFDRLHERLIEALNTGQHIVEVR